MSISRRAFIRKGVQGSVALSVLPALKGCGNPVQPAPLVNTTVDPDGIVRVEVAKYPDLAAAGGAITLHLGLPKTTPFPAARGGILLIHRGTIDDPPEYIAVQSPCPHLGCPLGYSADQNLIECPCHGSRFLTKPNPTDPMSCVGSVEHAPAKAGLTLFNVAYRALTGSVNIDLTKTVSCALRNLPPVAGGQITIPLADYPELANVGRSLLGHSEGLADDLILVRVDDTTVRTLSAVCTHLQCDVAFIPTSGQLECPCHGSAFSLDGAVINGPAVDPIAAYPTTFDGTTVLVTVP